MPHARKPTTHNVANVIQFFSREYSFTNQMIDYISKNLCKCSLQSKNQKGWDWGMLIFAIAFLKQVSLFSHILAAVWVSRYLAVQFCFLPEACPDQRLSLVSPSLFGYAINSWETLAEVTFSPAVFSQLQSEAIWEFTSNMTHWLPWNQSILGSVGRLYGNNEASELSSSCHCCKIHIQDNCSCWALKAAWTAFLQLSGK